MWLQRFTHFLLRNRVIAVLLTFALTFVPVLGTFGIVIAALVTLVQGVVEGAIFTLAATLPFIISYFITGNHDTSVQIVVWAAIGVAVLSNILTWVFAVMLRRQASWSLIIQIAALLGVLVISVIHLVYPNVADWWGNQLQSYYTHMQTLTGALATNANATKDAQLESINITKHYATGLMVSGVLFNSILQLIIARWWQATVFNPGSLRKELRYLRLSHLAGVLYIISLMLYYWGNSVVLDIMPVLYILFGAAGLSLIHYLIGLIHSPTAWFWLFVIYTLLLVLMPASAMIVGMLALLDIWLDLRSRMIKA